MFKSGIDGIVLSFIRQDCYDSARCWPPGQHPFPSFHAEVATVKAAMPDGSHLMLGAYYNDNSCSPNRTVAEQDELCSATGFRSIVEGSMQLFDDGTLASGALVYWGCGLSKDCDIPQARVAAHNRSHWDAVALPSLLRQRVYPHLGAARCIVLGVGADGGTKPLSGALVQATWGRGAAPAARVVANASGSTPTFGGWVGVAEKQPHSLTVSSEGFKTEHLSVQLERGSVQQVVVHMRLKE